MKAWDLESHHLHLTSSVTIVLFFLIKKHLDIYDESIIINMNHIICYHYISFIEFPCVGQFKSTSYHLYFSVHIQSRNSPWTPDTAAAALWTNTAPGAMGWFSVPSNLSRI